MKIKTINQTLLFLFVLEFLLFNSICFLNSNGIESIEENIRMSNISSRVWKYSLEDSIDRVEISSDGKYFVATVDYKLYIFDIENKTLLWNTSCGTSGNMIRSISISSDGQYLAAGSDTSWLYFFNRENSTALWHYDHPESFKWPILVKLSSDGQFLIAIFGFPNPEATSQLFVFNTTNNNPLLNYSFNSKILSLDISSDGRYIVTGATDKKLYFFDREIPSPLWTFKTGNDVHSVAISEDGNYIAAGSDDNKIYLFERMSNVSLWNYTTPADVDTIEISSDGQYIVAGTSWDDGRIYFFNRTNNNPLWTFSPSISSIIEVDISSNGEYIAMTTTDKVFFFNRIDNKPLWTFSTKEYVSGIALPSDANFVLAGSDQIYLIPNNYNDSIINWVGIILIGIAVVVTLSIFFYLLYQIVESKL